ncbi:MAG: hypothetical protein NZ740_09960 [Kiritimatiellae bacterium]|nr:hypothetical protein [Kiritimatiellia bacterium]MDW8459417.1 hypothetical protein [Verrucomicrobiota bacterium]
MESAPAGQLEHGVVGEGGGIVDVGVACGQRVDALLELGEQGVVDFGGLPTIRDGGGQTGREVQFTVTGLEQQKPAIAGELLVRKLDVEGFVKKVWKKQTVCRNISHWKTSHAVLCKQLNVSMLQRFSNTILQLFHAPS